MLSSLNLDSTILGLIASINYIGYLIGSLLPIFFKITNKKYITIFSLLLIVFTIFLMSLSNIAIDFFKIKVCHRIIKLFSFYFNYFFNFLSVEPIKKK